MRFPFSLSSFRAGRSASLLLLLPLSACLGGPSVPNSLLTLTPTDQNPASAERVSAQGESITILDPNVPQALRTNRLPVYVSDTSIQYLKDAAWVENPGPLFRRLLGEIVSARTGRVVLDPAHFSLDPGTRLTGQLHRFGLDPNAMEVVVVYEAAIARPDGALAVNRFESRMAVAEATPAAVAPALNQAANQVAEQVATWIGGAL